MTFGRPGPYSDVTLGSSFITSKTNGFVVKGPGADLKLGSSLTSTCALGDVNGDQIDDFAVSTTFYRPTSDLQDTGAVWVIYGQDNPATVADVDLSISLGSAGIQITGAASYDFVGSSTR